MEDDCGRPWNDPHPFGRPLRPKTKSLEHQGPTVDRLQVEATERQVHWREDYNETRPCEVAVISGCGMCGLVRALPGNAAQGLRSSFRRAVRAVTACHGVLRRLPPRRRRHPPANGGSAASAATAEAVAAPPSFTLLDELADQYGTAPSSPRAWSSIGHGVFAAPFHGTTWRSSNGNVAMCELDLTTVPTTANWLNHRLNEHHSNGSDFVAPAATPAAVAATTSLLVPSPAGHASLQAPTPAPTPALTPTVSGGIIAATAAATAAAMAVPTATVNTAAQIANANGLSRSSSGDSSYCCSMMGPTASLRRSSIESSSSRALSSRTVSLASPYMMSSMSSAPVICPTAWDATLMPAHIHGGGGYTSAGGACTSATPLPALQLPPRTAQPQVVCKDIVREEGMPLLPYRAKLNRAAPRAAP